MKIALNEQQIKLVESGWGSSIVSDTTVEKITYVSDGLKVKGYAAFPSDKKKYPSVVWCRGGYSNLGELDDFTAYGILGQIASWGYTVFAPQYRGNRYGEGTDMFGGEDVNDVMNLVDCAGEFESADTSVWGIEGWSRGGMMAYLALTKSGIFNASIIINGIADLKCNSEKSPFMKNIYREIKDKVDDFEKFCSSRSISNFPEKLNKTNLLIVHGGADKRVSPSDSLNLSQKLLQLEYPHRFILIENGDHFLRSQKKEVNEIRKSWFKKHLRKEK